MLFRRQIQSRTISKSKFWHYSFQLLRSDIFVKAICSFGFILYSLLASLLLPLSFKASFPTLINTLSSSCLYFNTSGQPIARFKEDMLLSVGAGTVYERHDGTGYAV